MFAIRVSSRSVGLAATAFLFMSLASVTFAADPTYEQVFSNKSATGEELANAFLNLASHTGSPSGTVGTTAEQDEASKALVEPYLDPAFQLQRASGQRYTAENFLPADLDEFEVGDLRETRPAEDVVVMRYSVRASQTLPDAALVMSKDKAPRLTVFHWSDADSRWTVLSHANFNTPVAAICDQKPIVKSNVASSVSAEDKVLGERLLTQFYDLLMKGDAAPIYHADIQVQSASGLGYTTLVERKKTSKYSHVVFSEAVVTRTDHLLVVSSYTTAEQRTYMEVNQLRNGAAPSMLTFAQGDDGVWRVIAIASFAPLKNLPDGVACVPSGALATAP